MDLDGKNRTPAALSGARLGPVGALPDGNSVSKLPSTTDAAVVCKADSSCLNRSMLMNDTDSA